MNCFRPFSPARLFVPAFLASCLIGRHVFAQEPEGAQKFLQTLSAKTPKTVIAVFDVSGSMTHQFPGRTAPEMDVARPFAQDLVNQGLHKGDRFVLYTFDKAPHKVLDEVVSGDLNAVLDKLPSVKTLSADRGTDIRLAHYEGLKRLEQETRAKHPAFLVFLSDGFHDSPDAGDPNYANFYLPGGRLDALPDTPQARDYQRLASQFREQNFGVGVRIASNGLVEEEVPQAATPTPAAIQAPTAATNGAEDSGNSFFKTWGLPLGAVLAGLLALGAWSLFGRPIRVGLGQTSDARKNKIFPLKHGGRITLGGVGAGGIPTAFDVPQTKAAVGHIVRSGQNFSLKSVADQPDGALLSVNGQPVNGAQRLSFGDQIRVRFPGGDRDQLFTFNQASAFKTLLNR